MRQRRSWSGLMRFSLITITTLGYGALAGAGELVRLLAITEAVLGHVRLVTVAGVIVGLLAQHCAGATDRTAPGTRIQVTRSPLRPADGMR